jgi:hypothetical protein
MKKKHFLIAAFAILTALSCRKNDVKSVEIPKKLYVLSIENDGASERNFIRYSANGVSTSIGDGITTDYWADDLDVNGNDVYVLVKNYNPNTEIRTTVIYKNGVEFQTVNTNNLQNFNCLVVKGNDIYLGGTERASNQTYKLILWKNGVLSDFTSGQNTSDRVYDIAVEGNDVYFAGQSETANGYQATYWKNGSATYLNPPNEEDGEIHRILVRGGDVFCSGMVNEKPTTWKNGVATQLTNAYGTCYGIAVDGNDVYAAGSVANEAGNYHSVYWKNGVMTTLTSPATSLGGNTFGIAVDKNDVYVVGSVRLTSGKYKAVYWKNGVEQDMNTAEGNESYGYRMVVH